MRTSLSLEGVKDFDALDKSLARIFNLQTFGVAWDTLPPMPGIEFGYDTTNATGEQFDDLKEKVIACVARRVKRDSPPQSKPARRVFTRDELHMEGAKRWGPLWLAANEAAVNITQTRYDDPERKTLMVGAVWGALYAAEKNGYIKRSDGGANGGEA